MLKCKKYVPCLTLLLITIFCIPSTLLALSLDNDIITQNTKEIISSGSIYGFVKESITGEELIGANIIIKNTNKGTASDENGYYKIDGLESGYVTIIVSYLGFKKIEIDTLLANEQNLELNIYLEWEGVTGEEITVSAQARGQISAINQQLASNKITNIVAKDRILEMPDVNAAESIGRLPGISLQRSGGEANKVVIRGLSPKYNSVTINGVRVPSTDTDNRSIDLSLITNGMLDGIEVTKALTADQDADALGGAIDLKIRTADDDFQSNFQLQGGYTALQETYNNYNFSGSISNRFFNSVLGIIANINSDRYDRSADILNGGYNLKLVNDNNIVVVNSLRLNERYNERKRLGGSIILDYQLPNGEIVLNSIYNRLSNSGFGRNNFMNVASDIHSYTMEDNFNTTFISANSLTLEQEFRWFRYDFTISNTMSESKSPHDYSWEFREESARNAVQEDTLGLYNVPSIFRNDLTNTSFYRMSRTFRVTDEDEKAYQINVEIPITLSDNISGFFKTGGKIRYLNRVNNQNQLSSGSTPYYGGGADFRRSVAWGLSELAIDPEVARLPMEPFLADYSRSNFIDGRFEIGYTPEPTLMHQLSIIAQDSLYLSYDNYNSGGRDYSGKEKYDAYYIMSKFDIGKYFSLIPGIRWEKEYTNYSANYVTSRINPPAGTDLNENYKDTTTTRESEFILPMVHFQFKPNDVIILRLAYTETISRPDYTQFAPITFYSPIGNWANAPNGNLNTSKSKNYDASLSIFQSKVGLLTFSAFIKEIDDLITSASFNLIENQNILPGLEIREAGSSAPKVSTYINLPKVSSLRGYEVDWQTNFWYLPSVFKGLVLNINYTHIVSEATYPTFELLQVPIEPRPRRPPFTTKVLNDTSFVSDLPDQPNDIFNVTLGYDLNGFSARLSVLYQSKTTTGSFGRQFEKGDDLYVDDYLRFDLSIQQKFTRNLQIYANLNNLNNRQDVRQQSNTNLYPTRKEYYGFTMDIGFRYKF